MRRHNVQVNNASGPLLFTFSLQEPLLFEIVFLPPWFPGFEFKFLLPACSLNLKYAALKLLPPLDPLHLLHTEFNLLHSEATPLHLLLWNATKIVQPLSREIISWLISRLLFSFSLSLIICLCRYLKRLKTRVFKKTTGYGEEIF